MLCLCVELVDERCKQLGAVLGLADDLTRELVAEFELLEQFLALVVAGCSSGDGARTEAPAGWETAEGRWWQTGIDTTQAFRNLESLQAMGVSQQAYVASVQGVNRDQFTRAVKQELLPLYRNHPQIVDSLFQDEVRPLIEEADLSGDLKKTLDEYKNRGYKALSKHFREPRTETSLGEDVPIVYPDTLRTAETSGAVEMQIRLNAEGAPESIKLLEPVHPTLDAIAMNAATRMRWQPAYLLVDDEWQPVPSWVRFSVRFQPPGG